MIKNNPGSLSPIGTNRDILIFRLVNDEVLVIGCDSAGGIGPKPFDKIRVDAFTLGKFTTRTALMEVLAVGANPICIVNTLSVEPKPTGNQILKGIRTEAKKVGLDPKLAVTGSTEKNIIVQQTGIGVTVIGRCRQEQLKIGTAQPDDIVVSLGIPCMGEDVLSAEVERKNAETQDILKLRDLTFIHELLPVGSFGIKREAQTLAEGSNLKAKIFPQDLIDVEKSAGPGTVLLVALPKNEMKTLRQLTKKPISIVAQLYAP